MNDLTFGDFVREIRTRQKLGLREFARRIGEAPSAVLSIERNRRPHWRIREKLQKMADVLGIDPAHSEYGLFWSLAGQMDAYLERVLKRPLVPALLRTVDDMNLNDEELAQLIDYVNQISSRKGVPNGRPSIDCTQHPSTDRA